MSFLRFAIVVVFIGLLCPTVGLAQADIPANIAGAYVVDFTKDDRTIRNFVTLAQEGNKIIPTRFLNANDLGGGAYDPENGQLVINAGNDKGEIRISATCAFDDKRVVCEGQGLFQSLTDKNDQAVLEVLMRASKDSPER